MKREYYLQRTDDFQSQVKTDGYAVMHSYNPNNDTHSHPHYFELGYLASGTAAHTLNGEKTNMRVGDFFIMDYGSKHSYYGDANCEMVNLLFQPRLIDEGLGGCTRLSELVSHFLISYLPQNMSRVHWQIFHDSDGNIARLIDAIAEEQTKRRPGARTMVRSYMIQLLVTIMRQVGAEQAVRYSPLIGEIVSTIEQRYKEPISLSALGRTLNYSPAYLSRRFTAEVGVSFSDYLQHYRLERAGYRLATGQESVSAIAESVGYKDVRFFYRLFHREYGLTPTEYRKKFIGEKR